VTDHKVVQSRATKIVYAFGHLVASCNPQDPHHGDSGDLAYDCLRELGYDEDAIEDLRYVAEHVAGDWEYTGRAVEEFRRIEAGEI